MSNKNQEQEKWREEAVIKRKTSRTTMLVFAGFAVVGCLVLVIVLPIYFTNNDGTTDSNNIITVPPPVNEFEKGMIDIETDSGYVNVRSDAYLYWLLCYQDDSFAPSGMDKLENVPVVMWLQGGPGAASTGYGFFEEIGPLDLNYNRRKTSWTGLAHILFVDQPVGTGFSYVTNENAYATDVNQAATDLVSLLHGFYAAKPEFQSNPLYIFCQSYGAKFAVAAGSEIMKEVEAGALNINFQGVGLGSAYISPIDSLMSWGDYLHHMSLLDQQAREEVNAQAALAKEAVDNNNWIQAYNMKIEILATIAEYTDNVDIYNILYPHLSAPQSDPYPQMMNNDVAEYFGNIPENVVWGSQRSNVENAMQEDIMKPVVDTVDTLIKEGLNVVVYNGMLDMIVSTPGQESWLDKLTWANMNTFDGKSWTPELYANGDTGGFSKRVANFAFWWIIDAGHDIPVDQPDFMLKVLYNTLNN